MIQSYHITGKFRGAALSICNFEYSVPKEIPAVCHSGSDYDSHFIIKKLLKVFEEEFNCLGELLKNAKPFQFQQQKKLKELVKMKKKLQKSYPANYNLLVVQDLWRAHYKILLTALWRNS